MSDDLHVLGVAHTVPHEDYLVCAFTAKVMLFPEVIQPFGWQVVEYSNEGSASQAHEHVVVLSKDRLEALSKRKSREEPLDPDVGNKELQEEFQRLLIEKIQARARPGDIVCHVWGPNMEVFDALPKCFHVELNVGYTASPGLPFRIYESSAWMHWHYGKAGQEDGNNYKWVIPSSIDTEIWDFCDEPDEYAIFLGRVTPRKGIDTLLEIARRMPELSIHVYGPGDATAWATKAPANLLFKGPIFGKERVAVVQRAQCMLMPTVFIEPFGNSGVEAQLCGVPLIGVSFGAFQETIVDGVTGYRCHTLADWIEAIRLSRSLDRRKIAASARSRYSKETIGSQYNWALRQLADLSGPGWYGEKSRKFADAAAAKATEPRKPRIWLFIPYFGAFPNYFQLYLDSLGRNADCLSVFLMTDIDLSGYRLPDNLIPIPMTLGALREKAARLIGDEFGIEARPEALLKQPKKLIDFKIMYPELFRDIGERRGVTEDDFVGWGDVDLIYGRFSDFLDMDKDYKIIGGFHGHVTAVRNIESFRKLFRTTPNLPEILVDEKVHIADEIAFRKPLLEFLERNQYEMFYINRYFCDIVPECFFGLFRKDHAQRKKNFFDAYNPDKDIDHVYYDRDGRLTVVYDNGESRQSIYCHLQKRAMSLDFDRYENGYAIREDTFRLAAEPCRKSGLNGNITMSENIEKNLVLWDRNYKWVADGNEWVGPANTCGVPYETWKTSLISRLITPYAAKDVHALEIAPGHGRWSEFIIDACLHATLVDLSPACLDFCRTRFAGRTNIDYFLTTGVQLPKCATGAIGFVFSYDSFVHMSAEVIGAYMSEIARVLVGGGAAVIHHADIADADSHRQEHAWQRSAVNRAIVRDLAERSGLKVRRQFEYWDEVNKLGCPGDAITLLHKD
jgi:hypothetical protein